MSTRRILFPLLSLVLAATACGLPIGTKPSPQPPPVTTTPMPLPTPTVVPALTLDQLKNAQVKIIATDQQKMIRLTDGKYEQGTDPNGTDYANINMGPQVAYGDLNGDGAQDAAIIIGENYGGSGDFVSVVAMLNQGGQPVYGGSLLIDDRPKVNAIAIQNGEILLDAVIHGANDPGCCPAQPMTASYRLWGGKLMLSRFTTKTPGGVDRVIQVDSPPNDSEVSGPFTINGRVSVAPFENNLTYAVFLEGAPEPAMQSHITVQASDPGSPGTFSLPLDLASAGIAGKVRIEISDLSAADGSYFAMTTLFVTAK